MVSVAASFLTLWSCDSTPTCGSAPFPPCPSASGAISQTQAQAIAAAAASSATVLQAEKDKEAMASIEAAKAKAATDLRTDVQERPDKYLRWSAPVIGTHGLLNKTTQLTGLTVLNASRFALMDVQGTVTWVDGAGNALPTTTQIALSGSIVPGATAALTLGAGIQTSGTIGGKGSPQQITFTHATIVTP
jgi:hypothetical protein